MVGRHAMLFDDDAMAAFVNTTDALVDWNSLSIDRYDVRHLLPSPPPSLKRRQNLTRSFSPSFLPDSSLEQDLDHERYLDLPEQVQGNQKDLNLSLSMKLRFFFIFFSQKIYFSIAFFGY